MSLHRSRLILSQGDPGLFDVLKRLGRAGTGFLTGGIPGAIGGFALPFAGPRGGVPTLPPIGSIARPGGGTIPILDVPGVRGFLERSFPGGATGLQVANAAIAPFTSAPVAGIATLACPSGFHPNKGAYMTRMGFVAKGSKCVRNRRRNLSNGRANSRALRRMAAWDKQERKRSKVLRAIARK